MSAEVQGLRHYRRAMLYLEQDRRADAAAAARAIVELAFAPLADALREHIRTVAADLQEGVERVRVNLDKVPAMRNAEEETKRLIVAILQGGFAEECRTRGRGFWRRRAVEKRARVFVEMVREAADHHQDETIDAAVRETAIRFLEVDR